MKIIAIGDIHGRNQWKQIDISKYDKIIFIGDYCDSYNKSNVEILVNLQEIIELKRNNFNKVILLLGNHDIQYMFWDGTNKFYAQGFRAEISHTLTSLFVHNRDCFQAAEQIDNYLFTHAGVCKGWYYFNEKIINHYATTYETKNLAETFNLILNTRDNDILHQCGQMRKGFYPDGGITWADKIETTYGYIKNYHQIVGHTRIFDIERIGNENESITYIDVLDDCVDIGKFYEIEIKEK